MTFFVNQHVNFKLQNNWDIRLYMKIFSFTICVTITERDLKNKQNSHLNLNVSLARSGRGCPLQRRRGSCGGGGSSVWGSSDLNNRGAMMSQSNSNESWYGSSTSTGGRRSRADGASGQVSDKIYLPRYLKQTLHQNVKYYV